jgi:serine/threonine-protein kinase
MSDLTRDPFPSAIVKSGLLTTAQVKERLARFAGDPAEANQTGKGFAAWLVKSGDLTRYQAQRLLAGRTEGFLINQYKILDRLGAGGMGKVYLAVQLRLDRQVALKVLPQQFAEDAEYVARFEREARAAARLKHPHIVQVYDVGRHGNLHYIVMELVRGKNLSDLLASGRTFSVAESLVLMQQAASGLGHAHEQGIVHRDIKPSNLVLEGHVLKILDLGLARRSDAADRVTAETKALGTPDYMSPEQLRDSRATDARSDVYSLGCTWYELLSGRPPFAHLDLTGKILAHASELARPIHSVATGVPDGVSALLHRMLAKAPSDRPQSCAELMADLGRLAGSTTADRRAIPTTAWTPDAAMAASAERMQPSGPITPSGLSDSDTLVSKPSASLPMMLVYLVPIMAALVLGGVYLGIRIIRDQIAGATDDSPTTPPTEPSSATAAPSDVAAQPDPTQQAKPGADASTYSSKGDSLAGSQPDPESSGQASQAGGVAAPPPPTDGGTGPSLPNPGDTPPATSSPVEAPQRSPKTMTVGRGEGQIADFQAAWEAAAHGDQIEVAEPFAIETGPLQLSGKDLTLSASSDADRRGVRPMIVLVPPRDVQAPEALWRIEAGRLTIDGVDLWIDLSKSKDDRPVVVFQLDAADMLLRNCVVTVVGGALASRAPATLVRAHTERPWDPGALGNPPPPVTLDLRDCVVRGPHTVFEFGARQAVVRMENVLVATPGSVFHFFHVRPHEHDHQTLLAELAGCTLDAGGPLVTVDCRPYELLPAPLVLRTTRCVLMNSTTAEPPAQVLWQSPVDAETISASLVWEGDSNAYWQRGAGLQAKTSAGPLVTYVESPGDWTRLELGRDEGWQVPQAGKPVRGPWHERAPADYSPYGRTPGRADRRRPETADCGVTEKQLPLPAAPRRRPASG